MQKCGNPLPSPRKEVNPLPTARMGISMIRQQLSCGGPASGRTAVTLLPPWVDGTRCALQESAEFGRHKSEDCFSLRI